MAPKRKNPLSEERKEGFLTARFNRKWRPKALIESQKRDDEGYVDYMRWNHRRRVEFLDRSAVARREAYRYLLDNPFLDEKEFKKIMDQFRYMRKKRIARRRNIAAAKKGKRINANRI